MKLEVLIWFLSICLMTGCACVLYTDKRREKDDIVKTIIGVLQVHWHHLHQWYHLSITKRSIGTMSNSSTLHHHHRHLTVRLSRSNCMISVLSENARKNKDYRSIITRAEEEKWRTLVWIFVQCIEFGNGIIKSLDEEREKMFCRWASSALLPV